MTLTPASSRTVPTLLPAVLLAALVAAVYWPAATFEFVRWDDQVHLSQNPLMNPPTLAHIAVFWYRPYYGLYVPVTYTLWALFALIARVPGTTGTPEFNPYLFHSLNIVTHFLAVLLVWRLVYRLVQDIWAAWIAAALFAVHPMCVEPVAWVSGFRDVFSALLGFGALLMYFPFEKFDGRAGSSSVPSGARTPRVSDEFAWARYSISTLLFLLAILAKPGAVAFVPMAAALDLLWFHRRIAAITARLLPWTAAVAILAWVTHRIQGFPPAIDTPPWWQRPLVAGDAITFYMEKLVLPIRLCVQYDHSPHRVLARAMAIKPTMIALAVAIAIYFLGRRRRWVWLAGALFLAGLLPVLGLEPFIFQYFSTTADRYLYIALLGAAVAVAFILANNPRPVMYYAAVAIVCIFSVLSFQQVLTWRSTQTVFNHVLKINPNSNMALVKLSWEKLNEGDPRSAELLARHALDIRPDDVRAWIDLGASLEELHRPDEARDCYLHVIRTDNSRESAGAYSNLAAMRADHGDYTGAISLYQQALHRDPDLPEARIGLSAAQQRAGKP